jgi:hypothetical protein
MARLHIDLRDDPEVPLGRELMEQLVGAHMVAHDEEELLHLVRHAIDSVFSAPPERAIRILTHSAYRGQDLIVRLLDLAARQQLALLDAGVRPVRPSRLDDDREKATRLELWGRLRDDQL